MSAISSERPSTLAMGDTASSKAGQKAATSTPRTSPDRNFILYALAFCGFAAVVIVGICYVYLKPRSKPKAIAQSGDSGTARALYCVYDIKKVARSNYTIHHIPYDICKHIIICCNDPVVRQEQTLLRDLLFVNRNIRRLRPTTIRYLGLKYSAPDRFHFAEVAKEHSTRVKWYDDTFLYLRMSAYHGILFYVPDATGVDVTNLEIFYFEMSYSATANNVKVIISMPKQINLFQDVLNLRIFSYNVTAMFTTHHFAVPDNSITCPAQLADVRGTTESYEGVDTYMRVRYRDLWDGLVVKQSLFSISLRGYFFNMTTEYPHYITYVPEIELSFTDICQRCSEFSSRVERHFVDSETDCYISMTEKEIRTSISPSGPGVTTYMHHAAGFVIFDMDLDDFRGICSPRHNLLYNIQCDFLGEDTAACEDWLNKLQKYKKSPPGRLR